MSYNKKTWAKGDIISSDALNNIETTLKMHDERLTTMEIAGTLGEDGGKTTLTAQIAPEDLYAAVKQGRLAVFSFSFEQNQKTVEVESVTFITGIKVTKDEVTNYQFLVITDKEYRATCSAGDESVTMTEV